MDNLTLEDENIISKHVSTFYQRSYGADAKHEDIMDIFLKGQEGKGEE